MKSHIRKRISVSHPGAKLSALSGILKACLYHLYITQDSTSALVRADAPIKGKVGNYIGGGPAHLPDFLVMLG